MGASVSSNIIDIVNKVLATVSTDIVQRTAVSTDTSQIISVSDTSGDVWITGNEFIQRATLNITALMQALSTESAQQQLILQLSQEAKAMISGLNVGQFADASNTMNILIEATINMVTNITQTCAASSRQGQTIEVRRTKGNVYIQNNVFSQVADILSTCTQEAVANSSELQDLNERLDQKASASAEGLSPWAIAIIVGIIFGVPVVGGVVGGYYVMKFIFPLIIVAGIVMIFVYYYWSTTDMKAMGFSSLIANTSPCAAQPLSSSTMYKDAVSASNDCLKDANCVAYDWQGIVVQSDGHGGSDGTYKILVPPATTFYKSIASACSTYVKPDQVSTVRFPQFLSGPNDPTTYVGAINGDAYLNTTTSAWFQLLLGHWIFKDNIVKSGKFGTIAVGNVVPKTAGKTGDVFVLYSDRTPDYMEIYEWSGTEWIDTHRLQGPGIAPDAPTITNASGFKVQNRKSALLYLGIAAIVIGIVGTIVVFVAGRKKTTPTAGATASSQ